MKRIFVLLLIAALVLLPVSAAFADGESDAFEVPEYIAKTDGGKNADCFPPTKPKRFRSVSLRSGPPISAT